MRLSDVLHQPHAHVRIQRAIAGGRTPHAYLFTGPEGIGKEMMAARLAARLLCSRPEAPALPAGLSRLLETWSDACGHCIDCDLMEAGNHPDYHRIYRMLAKLHPDREVQKRKATELSVDVVRHFLIEKTALRPSRERAKIFVVSEADRLNDASQNAILKTLEEPPEHSYIILLCSSGAGLLPTTRSRCQHIEFNGLPTDFIERLLIDSNNVDAPDARFLAELAQGSAGKALQYHELGISAVAQEILPALAHVEGDALAFAKLLVDLSKKLAQRLSGGSADDPEDDNEENADLNMSRLAQVMLLTLTATILRDVLRTAVGRDAAAFTDSTVIRQLAAKASSRGLRGAIRAVSAAEYQIRRNAQVQLVFDVAALAIGKAFQSSPVPA